MFQPHQNLSDRVNGNIIRSEIEGGVYLRDLPDEAEIEVVTQNRGYTLVVRSDGSAWICGHPEFCPVPVLVRITGSNWGGSMLKAAYIGRGHAHGVPASGLSGADHYVEDRGYTHAGRKRRRFRAGKRAGFTACHRHLLPRVMHRSDLDIICHAAHH